MNIVKYDPFRELNTLQNEMNRLFTGAFPRGLSQEEITRGAWTPSVDIDEGKDQLVLEAELPGMKRQDVELSIENNIITLRGERKFEKKEENDNYHRVERGYGSFTRSFTLPPTVSGEGATANFIDGILRISLPKREEAKARKIEIRGEKAETKVIDAKGKAANA